MAKLPIPVEQLVQRFGPHRNDVPAGGWKATGTPDQLVKTHCCFCGQQCGIQLKVRDNKVVGFEPWEEFPFNEGKLCPKASNATCRTSIPIACSARSCARRMAISAKRSGTRLWISRRKASVPFRRSTA